MLFLGFRALIDRDEGVLCSQLGDARRYFPGSRLVAAVCGDRPSEAVTGLCDDVLYYSEKPLGITLPWHHLIEHAKGHGAGELLLCDGDDQFIFSELRRVYDMANGRDAIVPVRRKKSLFFQDDCIDRVLIEECENLLFRAACPNTLRDPQPGALFLMTGKAIACLSMETVPSWIADLAATAQLLGNGCTIAEPEIDIREQGKTHMTLGRELLKIRQMERYFGVSFLEAIPDNARYTQVRRCYESYLHDRPCDQS
jgi:hypothetical protein